VMLVLARPAGGYGSPGVSGDERHGRIEVRLWPTILMTVALALIAPTLCPGQTLKPREALDRYLAAPRNEEPACSNADFAVQIDASLPALKKHGSMTGFRRITRPGHIVYRGLRFTGDNVVKNQVIARVLARDSNPTQSRDIAVTPQNYLFTFDKISDYNGLGAYVFLLRPRRKRGGLFRGELWLDAETAAPLRLWGDLVKSPSIFIRSARFVQDYQRVHGCSEPLRLLVTTRTRIAGTAEMTMWLRPASEEAEAQGREEHPSGLQHGDETKQ